MRPSFLQTQLRESWPTRRYRFLMNCYPMFFGTGGKILFWSSCYHEIHVRLRLNMWTYNLVGTMFGGSMFAAADPFYMVMLHQILGKEYVVWDKAAFIRFRKPGRTKIYMRFLLEPSWVEALKEDVHANGSAERVLQLEWKDAEGVVYANIERTLYVATKAHYEATKKDRQKVRLKG